MIAVLTLTEMLIFLAEFSLLESSLLQLLLAADHDLFVPDDLSSSLGLAYTSFIFSPRCPEPLPNVALCEVRMLESSMLGDEELATPPASFLLSCPLTSGAGAWFWPGPGGLSKLVLGAGYSRSFSSSSP